jgi:hypothetical protein
MPKYKLVYFEEFCLDPVRMTSEVFDFLGLDIGRQTTRFVSSSSSSSKNDGADKPTSQQYYSVSRNSTSVPRSWAKRLSKDPIDRVLKIATLSKHMSELLCKPIGEASPRAD